MKNVLDTQCPIEKGIVRASFVPSEKDLIGIAGDILCKEYDPSERERAEKVYYWPHVPGKPNIFSYSGSKYILF